MDDIRALVVSLIGNSDLSSMTAEDIAGNISLNLYEQQNSVIWDKQVFDRLPDIIKDIILIIDFDTELGINGILGFVENSSGLFLEDTIQALKRIEAFADCEILKNIQNILFRYGVTIRQLRDDVNTESQYDITNFTNTHGSAYDDMAHEISKESEGLYLYQDERDIFSNLFQHIDRNKSALIAYLKGNE